ncbi:MAG: TRAP transporter substrate-binding protein [Vicinamibacteria bacterium]|nr:TRAP transporter substrate-binding protein [Vicinamibacteria bacterium]
MKNRGGREKRELPIESARLWRAPWRKRMVKSTVPLLALLLGLCLAGCQTRTGPKVLKIANGVSEQHPTCLASKKLEALVEARLPGKYDIQVYANAQLGDDVRATENVRMGTLEMVATSASPLTGLVPELNVFDLPFIVPNEKAADCICDGPVGDRLAAALESKGIKLLAYYENGFRQLTNSVREVRSPDDLRRLKIRTMQNAIHLDAFRAMGANPTPMPFSEVFTALQQKTIDGQENPIPTIWLSKFYEAQKYVTLTNHVYGPHILLINKKLWESFPPGDREIITDAVKESVVYQRTINRKMNKDLVDELRKAGVIVAELTADEIKAFRDAVAPVVDNWEPKIGKTIVDEFKAAAERCE